MCLSPLLLNLFAGIGSLTEPGAYLLIRMPGQQALGIHLLLYPHLRHRGLFHKFIHRYWHFELKSSCLFNKLSN